MSYNPSKPLTPSYTRVFLAEIKFAHKLGAPFLWLVFCMLKVPSHVSQGFQSDRLKHINSLVNKKDLGGNDFKKKVSMNIWGNIVEAYPKQSQTIQKTKGGLNFVGRNFRLQPTIQKFTQKVPFNTPVLHLPPFLRVFEEIVTKGNSAKIKPVEPRSKHNDWSTYPFPSPQSTLE